MRELCVLFAGLLLAAGCASDASVDAGRQRARVWWSEAPDSLGGHGATVTLVPGEPASAYEFMVLSLPNGVPEVVHVRLTAERGNLTTFTFTPGLPATKDGRIEAALLDRTIEWSGPLGHLVAERTAEPIIDGTVRLTFDAPASHLGPGVRYVIGVGGLGGSVGEGPTMIVADRVLEPLGRLDMFGSGGFPSFEAPGTIRGDAGGGLPNGYGFYLLPPDASDVVLEVRSTGTPTIQDVHAYAIGVVDLRR